MVISHIKPTPVTHSLRLRSLLPLIGLPLLVIAIGAHWMSWVFMWSIALAVYAGLKWLTVTESPVSLRKPCSRLWCYLLLWPGMDVQSFFELGRNVTAPAFKEWIEAFTKVLVGFILLFFVVPQLEDYLMFSGWTGMVGIVLVLHFGLFHLLSLFWRWCGIHAVPIMDRPIFSSSLSDFWGKRWNLAFRDLSYEFIFRPWVGRLGTAGATMAVFLLSGLVHDFVISVPASGGYGLPTVYFLIQGFGLLIEHSKLGKRLGLRRGIRGRLFCMAATLTPVGLLFHRPFIEQVVLPMLEVLGGVSFEVTL